MSDDPGGVESLRIACALAIIARRTIDRACERLGRDPLSLEELREVSPEYRAFELFAPASWPPLIELAARGDLQAIELLDELCELEGGAPVH